MTHTIGMEYSERGLSREISDIVLRQSSSFKFQKETAVELEAEGKVAAVNLCVGRWNGGSLETEAW